MRDASGARVAITANAIRHALKCGEGFAICNINGKEYVMLSMGWDEFGSGAYGFWPVEEVYAIDPNILDDEIFYRRAY